MTDKVTPLRPTQNPYSGGCQCGAIRFKIEAPLGPAGFCHCRMCQKAFGSFGAPLVSVPIRQLTWTRGAPSFFRSSAVVVRGFCSDCGTPLYMHEDDDPNYEIAIGAFDTPANIAPDHVVGIEARLPWVGKLANLPEKTTMQDRTPGELARLVSRQHPDHDTDDWPLPSAHDRGTSGKR